VAENKIRGRYRRLWTLVAEEIDQCRQPRFMTTAASKAAIAAQKSEGFIVVDSPRLRTRHACTAIMPADRADSPRASRE